jgi:hypothetical protein
VVAVAASMAVTVVAVRVAAVVAGTVESGVGRERRR